MTLLSAVRTDLLTVARRSAADPAGWSVRPRFDPVTRWYARLDVTTDYEVWLLTWLPGQGTDLHDHGGSAGAFTVVSGALVEQTPVAGRLVDTALTVGSSRRFGARHVHRVHNTGREPAVSLHVYGPALRSMTRYELVEGRLRLAAVARAGVSW